MSDSRYSGNRPWYHLQKYRVSVSYTHLDVYKRQEEERFHLTLKAGMGIVHDIIQRMHAANETVFGGSDLFMLYDTYGFPPVSYTHLGWPG